MGVEPKLLMAAAEAALVNFDWAGHVRQLVNACRRLTVTAPGRRSGMEDIPRISADCRRASRPANDWTTKLSHWAEQERTQARTPAGSAVPEAERILIRVALRKADGISRTRPALGWGRNSSAQTGGTSANEDVARRLSQAGVYLPRRSARN